MRSVTMDIAAGQLSASAKEAILKIGTLFITIGTIVNLASLIFLFWFRNKPIVAMGQPRLLAVMGVGSLVYVGGTVFKLFAMMGEGVEDGDDSEVFCNLSFLFYFLGAFAVDLILFLKLYRVYKVMRFRRGQTVLPRHIIAPFVVGLFVPAVLGTFNAIVEEECGPLTVNHIVFLIILYSLRVILMVCALMLRNVEESVGDTRRIFRYLVFAITNWTCFWLYYFCKLEEKIRKEMDNPNAVEIIAFILGLLPFFLHSVASTIFFVFPRMYLVWYERLHGHLPDHVQVYGGGNVHVNTDLKTSPGTGTRTPNAETTATTAISATLSRAEASAENPATTTKRKEIVRGSVLETRTPPS